MGPVDAAEDAPPPLIYAQHKHHLPAMAARLARLRAAAPADPDALEAAVTPFAAIGKGVCDVYTGALAVDALADELRAWLDARALVDLPAFAAHLEAHGDLQRRGHYLAWEASDGSRWVLRAGDDPARYAHLHPARHGPLTLRARTTVLRTALLAHALCAADGAEPAGAAARERLAWARRRLDLPELPAPDRALARLLDVIAAALER